MTTYTLIFARSARKELENLTVPLAERVLDKIEKLEANPRPSGSLKLKGGSNLWRIRVGDYRVIYSIDDQKYKVDVSMIRHRKDIYRDL